MGQKYQVAQANGSQVVVEVRNSKGEPLVLVPGSVVELSSEAARTIMEIYPGRISPVSSSTPAPPAKKADDKKKDDDKEDDVKKGHEPGGKPDVVTK